MVLDTGSGRLGLFAHVTAAFQHTAELDHQARCMDITLNDPARKNLNSV